MAVLSKIRNNGKLVVGIVFIALLGFILNDLFSGGQGNVGERYVGEIDGSKIDYALFDQKVQTQSELYKQRTGEISLSQEIMDQIREQVWNDFKEDLVLIKTIQKAGISVPVEELADMIQGSNPHPMIVQSFTNPQTGAFNRNDVIRYLQSLDDEKNAEEKYKWTLFEESLKKDRIANKYYNIIKKGLYVTQLEAKNKKNKKNTKVDISYVLKRYNMLPDSSVTFTEKELRKYYNEHNNEPKFQQKETVREIEYVSYPVIPTSDDTLSIIKSLEGYKAQFEKSKDDTLFVRSYGSSKNSIKYYTKNSIPKVLDSLVFNSAESSVVGPVLDVTDNTYKIAKVISTKFGPDSVRARHILIRIEGNDTLKAQSKADSIRNVLNSGMPFEILAQQFSQDQGSASKGGDLDWFTEGAMVKPFNDACFEGKKGDIKLVTSQFGIHIIEITDQTQAMKKILLAIVDKEIEPSQQTITKVFNTAESFSMQNKGAAFTEEGNKIGLRISGDIKESDKMIRGIGNARDLVRWTFEAKTEEVSEPFELDNQIIVAKLTKIKEKGLLSFEAMKEEIELEVIKQKKAEKFIQELSGANDLNSIASKWGSEVQTSAGINFSSYSIPGIGAERKLLGVLFAKNQGEITAPVIGDFGVYIAKIDNKQEPNVADYSDNKNQLKRTYTSSVDYTVFKTLQEIKEIKDNRYKFF